MAFLIGGANTLDDSYTIDNSLRFSDTNYLTRDNTTQSGGGTNFTFSAWLKMSTYDDGGYQGILSIFKDSNDYFEIYKDNSEKLQIGQNINGTSVYYQNQDFVYRDYSAWYHLVVSFNNSASGEINKIKTYVNGQEISADEKVTNSNPFGDVGLGDSAYDTRVGSYRDNTDPTWNGYMADVHLIAGQTLAASYFGETNDNGVWVPKEYTGTFGDNGFFLEFKQTGTSQNSSGMGADTSGEDNHLAVTGLSSIDVTVDTPTNNFCTWNPLIGRAAAYATFAEGNLDADFTSGSVYWRATGSIGVTSGKWYAEIKCIDDGGNTDLKIGVEHASPDQTTIDGVHKVIQSWNGYKASGGSAASFGDSYADGDIVGVLLDMDNGTIKFSKNGTMMASSASAYTDLISAMPDSGWAFFAYGYDNANVQANFGNAPFSISSGNADANGYGNFEYAVPSGYYALCTKNLAEYG